MALQPDVYSIQCKLFVQVTGLQLTDHVAPTVNVFEVCAGIEATSMRTSWLPKTVLI